MSLHRQNGSAAKRPRFKVGLHGVQGLVGRQESLPPDVERDQRRDVHDLGLELRPDGSPVRLRRNGRQKKAVGLYFSIKNGRHLPYESRLELHDLWRAEVRSDVVASWPQPFTLRFMLDGALRRYTPDRLDQLADGANEVVEVKDELRTTREPDYVRKLDAAAALLADRGMRFCVRERAEIEREPTLGAVEAVQRCRRTQVGAGQAVFVRDFLSEGPVALDDLAVHLGPGSLGRAIVFALVVRRVVEIDLSAGLQGDRLVKLVA